MTALRVSYSGPWTREPQPETGWGLSSPAPPPPARTRDAIATYRSARPPGAAARPPRTLPGEKKKPCRRSARAHSPPPLRRPAGGEAGPGRAPSRGGPREGGGGISPTPEPGSEGGPGKQAGEQPAGAARLQELEAEGTVPGHQLLSGRRGTRSRRLRGSATPIPSACSQKRWGGRPGGKQVGDWASGVP